MFVSLFFYFYKKSGRFRKSIASALFAALIFLGGASKSPPPVSAKGADVFSPQEQSRPYKRDEFFIGKSSNNGNGPGKPGDDGGDGDDDLPQYPKRESVKNTQSRVDEIRNRLERLKEITDSESESENECEVTADKVKVTERFESKVVRKFVKKTLKNGVKPE